jgi:hypothetical protein
LQPHGLTNAALKVLLGWLMIIAFGDVAVIFGIECSSLSQPRSGFFRSKIPG